jgi:hypothetical protein
VRLVSGTEAVANRRVIKGVLDNFLGTYTSRYTDYEGYWLFGLLVSELREAEFDLLAGGSGPESPHGVAERVAALKFAGQARKAGLEASQVRRAWLRMERLPESVTQYCYFAGRDRAGYSVAFRAGSMTDDGRVYERVRVVFVAPHDPLCELRRDPGNWGVEGLGRGPSRLR